jgi:hypothetical protein
LFPEEDLMMDIERRQRMAAERILENESIREGLDDNGASALLNWGVECAKRIAADTVSLEDEEEAEEASYPRTRALRQMLEDVKSLYRPELLPAEGRTLLAEIIEFASVVYGPNMQLPQRIFWNSFVASLAGEPGERINRLRALIENNFTSQGE